MKRLLGLLLASTLVLVACGNDENKEESKKKLNQKKRKLRRKRKINRKRQGKRSCNTTTTR
ncbi:hypothetical protein [Staphylococcus aureus]|uniref:hypothetical protein n=1 Tax=Staphylococcus aureus TaxID=1280 RepID=UPI0035258B83